MAAAFGEWIGTPGGDGKWTPQIDPAMVDDDRFPALLAGAKDGVSFANAVVVVTGASARQSIGIKSLQILPKVARVVITGSRDLEKITATAEQLVAETDLGPCCLPALTRVIWQNSTNCWRI